MLIVGPVLTVLNVSAEDWAERYDIRLDSFDCECYQCGRILQMNIPFAIEGKRGLKAPECACGYKNTPYIYSCSKEEFFKNETIKPRIKKPKKRLTLVSPDRAKISKKKVHQQIASIISFQRVL